MCCCVHRQEAAILGNLHHPHIVRLYGVCQHHPHLYLVTELMQTSLQRLLHGAPIPLETRLRIAVQVCVCVCRSVRHAVLIRLAYMCVSA